MEINRRKFLQIGAAAGGSLVCAGSKTAEARDLREPDPNWNGMLNDTTRCIGCKACQVACKRENRLEQESSLNEQEQLGQPIYDAPSGLSDQTYTLIKMHKDETGRATFVKTQCMHCNEPACASACIVGALQKQENGAVAYDADMCMGCRYCMVACPFSVPQFEWQRAIPSIKKCTLCGETRLKEGKPTACSSACPAGAIVFGKRTELIKLARQRIATEPERYQDHVYGEKEVGGTSVLYLTAPKMQFAALGLPAFEYRTVAGLTESIQHRIFQYFIPPIAVYSLLGGIMYYNQRRKKLAEQQGEPHA
ncbi:MAG: hydrogenase 2 operon protein HybA [Desulfuromonadales bacterium]|nr:hydrogenase 2 operon protein HybA [Desulfuromonadales bacterium]